MLWPGGEGRCSGALAGFFFIAVIVGIVGISSNYSMWEEVDTLMKIWQGHGKRRKRTGWCTTAPFILRGYIPRPAVDIRNLG
jgi:hypothetical protein